jgi:hypothetical protein
MLACVSLIVKTFPQVGVTLSWRPGNGACNKVRRWACHIIECRWCRLTKPPALEKRLFASVCRRDSHSRPPRSWRYGCCVRCFEAVWLRPKRSSLGWVTHRQWLMWAMGSSKGVCGICSTCEYGWSMVLSGVSGFYAG